MTCSVWHPLRGPCVDWPLAVCDASTVDFDHDTIASDFVDSWGYSENVQVFYSDKQRWSYLEKQMPNELLVFKSADSEEGEKTVFPGKLLPDILFPQSEWLLTLDCRFS